MMERLFRHDGMIIRWSWNNANGWVSETKKIIQSDESNEINLYCQYLPTYLIVHIYIELPQNV